MAATQKQDAIDLIKDRMDKMVSAVFVDYKGLDVAQVTDLRDQLREAGLDYKVVKNTIAKLAVKDCHFADDLGPIFRGMTAIAWSYEEPGAAAKIIKAFQEKNEDLTVKAAVVDGSVIGADAVINQLATMPGKDELRAKLLATFQAPSQQFVAQLSAPAQNFVYVLVAKEKGTGSEAA